MQERPSDQVMNTLSYKEVSASLSMIKSLGGVEAGSFMPVILKLWVIHATKLP